MNNNTDDPFDRVHGKEIQLTVEQAIDFLVSNNCWSLDAFGYNFWYNSADDCFLAISHHSDHLLTLCHECFLSDTADHNTYVMIDNEEKWRIKNAKRRTTK